MDSRTDAAGYGLRAGECRRGWREGRSLLGRVVLSVVRNAGSDHAQTDQWFPARDLRLGKLFGAVLHSRQRSRGTQTLLIVPTPRDVAYYVSLSTKSQASIDRAPTITCSGAGRDFASNVSTALKLSAGPPGLARRFRFRSPRERPLS